MLYFNLPEKIYKHDIKPQLAFEWEKTNPSITINELIEVFEKLDSQSKSSSSQKKNYIPNVILMRVDATNEDGEVQNEIIGGYSSSSWLITVGEERDKDKGGDVKNDGHRGDDSCFLFNLTQDLRFNARPGKDFYISAYEHKLSFGNTDLVINGSFDKVTSEVRKPKNVNPLYQDNEQNDQATSHFSIGNDLS